MKTVGVHWFRRDLRIRGNPALRWAWKRFDGRVVGLFIFDRAFLSRPDFSHDRFGFFLNTLKNLRDDLREMGSDLLVIDATPELGLQRALEEIRASGFDASVTFNRDYEPFAKARDLKVSHLLKKMNVTYHTESDHLLAEPDEMLKSDGTPYKVFTPFFNRWLQVIASEEKVKSCQSHVGKASKNKVFNLSWPTLLGDTGGIEDALDSFIAGNTPSVKVPLPPSGEKAVTLALRNFKPKIADYGRERDFPASNGTSGFSVFLKNGSLTTARIIGEYDLLRSKPGSGPHIFLKELAWREFYYSILHHFPEVESEAFIPKYRNIRWSHDKKNFSLWKDGLTGFPIVDAGMRQLKATGWMHNRVRMITASFLTKDLLIDWRMGERYFMEKLLDGDLAPNNGGWQWAASTGCDPQPYFRIFNPWLQGEKFDPDGSYIRKYVPELKNCPAEMLHDPDAERPNGYPKPMVTHAEQKPKALALFKDTEGN